MPVPAGRTCHVPGGRVAGICAAVVFLNAAAVVHAQNSPTGTPAWRGLFNDGERWTSYTEWGVHAGNHRSLVDGNWMVPLWQDRQSLLFADFRGRYDDLGSTEGNFGLAYRQMLDSYDQWIVGGYGYYDRIRTSHGNSFQQATLGLEALSVQSEARFNAYIPASGDAQGTAVAGGGAQLVGNTIFIVGGLERAYYGFDAEVGQLLHDWSGGQIELRGFFGGYHFDTSDSRFPNASGPRARLELRSYDLSFLGDGARVTLGVTYQWDQVRNDQCIGLVQVRVPLGRSPRRLHRLERRMLDRIVRDIDVVSVGGEGQEIAVDPLSGHLLTDLTIVDANTADVPGTIAAAGIGSSVFLDESQGPISIDAPIVTQPLQLIFGHGIDVRGQIGGARAIFAGGRAQILNSEDEGAGVVVAPHAVLRHFDIVGGGVGVTTQEEGEGLAALSEQSAIDNIHVSGAIGYGFLLGDVQGLVRDNWAEQSGLDGFLLYRDGQALGSVTETGVMTGNIAVNNGDNGFEIGDVAGEVSGNVAASNGGDGFRLATVSGQVLANQAFGNEDGFDVGTLAAGGLIAGNEATFNEQSGFDIGDLAGELAENLSADNEDFGYVVDDTLATGWLHHNTAQDNGNTGFYCFESRGVIADNLARANGGDGFASGFGLYDQALFVRNTAEWNERHGAMIGHNQSTTLVSDNVFQNNFRDGLNGLIINGPIQNNIARGNGEDGFDIAGASNTSITGNVAIGNGGHGMTSTSIMNTVVADNRAEGNGGNGFNWNTMSASSVVRNEARSNAGDGFRTSILVSTTVSDNVSADNGGRGFVVDVRTENHTTLSNNEAIGNTGNGYQVGLLLQTVIADNLSRENGGDGFVWDSAQTNSAIIGNRATQNAGNGFVSAGMLIGAEIADNRADQNAGRGFQFASILPLMKVHHNEADGNGQEGFYVGDMQTFLSSASDYFADNAASDNGSHGFRFGTVQFTSSILRNAADGNDGHGFFADSLDPGVTFQDNDSTSNTNLGYRVDAFTPGANISGNTGADNGDGGDTLP